MGDPLAWHPAERCLFVATTFLTFTVWYWALLLYIVRHPDAAPYVNQAFLPTALRTQVATIVAWSMVAACCLIARGRPTGVPVLVTVTLVLAVYELAYGSYFFGFYTSVFSGLTIIASLAVGLVLFSKPAVMAGFVALALALIGLTVLEQAGSIPYSPLFLTAPFERGTLHPSWLLGMGGVTLMMMLFIGCIVYFVIDRWHDREAKLAIASEQLARANDVISRYVASQLAEQVREGNYGAFDRHERRRLTLFFSDIEDFAATADLMEPEDLSTLLNDYLSEMTAIAERHGATIDKFVGDAIMIFFGAPSATSDRDHALRAVRMALEMQERLTALQREWMARGVEKPFRVRMGINTGQASIGNFGSRTRLEYTAIGRQVNLAARLQAQCAPGRVLLAHSTWVFVQDEIPCEPRGEISLKGFRSPVKIYEVAADATSGTHDAGGGSV